MASIIRFARGSSDVYSPDKKHLDYIYFATDQHKLYMNGQSYSGDQIAVQDTEPDDKGALWIDPTGDESVNQQGNLDSIRSQLQLLQAQMQKVMRVIEYGVIAGDSTVGARTQLMGSASPINPNGDDGTETQDDTQPSTLGYTVPNISVKCDTSNNFMKNKQNLIDGELVWITDKQSLYIYLEGSFKPISNGSGGQVTDDDNMTQSDIEKFYFNSIGLQDSNKNQYRVKVNDDGNVIVYNDTNYDNNLGNAGSVSGSYISDYLRINSIFLGGTGTKLDSFAACTHNFVELANASLDDINLNGIYLMYRADQETTWKRIALIGTIKAGSTFLIRGAQCACESNVTLPVGSCDMVWNDGDNPIEFSLGGGTFYLACSDNGKIYRNQEQLASFEEIDALGLSFVPYQNSVVKGYIDCVGIKTNDSQNAPASEGGSPISLTSSDRTLDCIFVRSFTIDICKQAQKEYAKRKSSALWTYVNMSRTGTDEFPYYPDDMKRLFVPKGSLLGKNIFGTRSTFDVSKPNMLNVTFGRQATTGTTGATRCFNWISVGYYDEYIEYKKESDAWNSAVQVRSILKGETYSDANINKFIDIYTRIKWVTTNGTAVTTHKAIVRGLSAGKYNVRVRRYNDDSYMGDVVSFTVRTDADVNKSGSFAQTTDQQAFNFYEYQAWEKAAYAIHKNHPDIQFTINTGDMTQNGNRECEWIDYYNARKPLADIEDMPTIGNNDLCGPTPYILGNGQAADYKINHKNMQFYYCFELDESNPALFTFDTKQPIDKSKLGDVISYTDQAFTYYMPSLYSFNYGKWHFICLNSEFAANTYKCYYNDENLASTFKPHAFYNMFKWLQNDYDATRNNIAYMHELPFCIVVANKTTGVAAARSETNGSKLNNDFSAGISYTPGASDEVSDFIGGGCYSEFFQTHNIKLCCGGHKHTYSLSYPTKENVVDRNAGLDESGKQKTRVDFANPIVDKTGGDGVVYAMCQATGYKLVSNAELPGSGINWLRQYFPVTTSSGVAASLSQYYPMYSLYNIADNNVHMQSYVVENIYNGKTAFNINNQIANFSVKNSTEIDNTGIDISYAS